MLDSNKYNSVHDFLKDTDFIIYVLDDDKTYDKYWHDYITKHPESSIFFEQAKKILLHLDNFKFLPKDDKLELKQRILKDISNSMIK